jgi:hypothetical protein
MNTLYVVDTHVLVWYFIGSKRLPLHLTPYVFIGDEVIQPGHQRPSIDGTMGILVRSIRRNQMESGEGLRTLRSIPSRSTLYLKPSRLDEVILKIKKEYNL